MASEKGRYLVWIVAGQKINNIFSYCFIFYFFMVRGLCLVCVIFYGLRSVFFYVCTKKSIQERHRKGRLTFSHLLYFILCRLTTITSYTTSYIGPPRRKIRLIENNAKCRHLKSDLERDFAAGASPPRFLFCGGREIL